MRDLEKDKEICDRATPGPWYQEANYWDEKNTVLGRGVFQYDSYAKLLADMIDREEDAEFIADARKGWPHAIERAINAEAEVERLQSENALLRKVVDLVSTMQESESGYSARLAEIEMLKALDDYEAWKDGQE
jgi:hypothetical protein